MVGTLKYDDGLNSFLNSIFNPICICLHEASNCSFPNSFSNSNTFFFFFNYYSTVLRDMQA